ncbi:MAG: NfeD family protein [Pseudomonadota bacterium]
MIDFINSNMAGFWIAVGCLLLALEILVLGFSTVIFMFAGIAAILTGLLVLAGVLPPTWIATAASTGILTGATGVLLWKPFKAMQEGEQPPAGHSSDLIGLEFVLAQDVTRLAPGKHRYSGVDWRVELARSVSEETLAAGSLVSVAEVDAGVFRVTPAPEK